MSNWALEMRLSQLESELRSVENYNWELRSDLNSIASSANSARNTLNQYQSSLERTLDNCDNRIVYSHHRIVDAIALQGEIERLYTCFKHMELASKKIREANNTKYYDFANYRTVRKIVQGVMDNLDVTMVSDAAIYKSVEAQHLLSPDYWLTCVLISIMAWKNDDRELAERSMARAMEYDKKSSAVFYMLFNLRMQREEAALKWFNTYQECGFTGADQRTFLMLFSLVSKSLSDNVSESAKQQINTFIRRIVRSSMDASDYSEERVTEQISGYFKRMRPSDALEYSALRKYCGAFNELTEVMMEASNNLNILEFILRTANVAPEQKNTFLKGFIDELIEAPNDTERAVYDTIEYNERIIDCKGDAEQAKQLHEAARIKKAKELDLVAEMIDWIYERNANEVNGQIRLNMFALTKELQEKAVDVHVEGYRSRMKSQLPVTIGDYSSTVDLSGTPEEEHQKVSDFYTARRDEAIATVKPWGSWIGFGIAAASTVGALFLGPVLLLLALCGAGYGAYVIVSNKNLIKKYNLDCTIQINSTESILRLLYDEYRQYRKEFEEYDGYVEQIRDAFSKI